MLLDLGPFCVSPGPPGKLSGAGQCESVSLPDFGKPNGSPAGQTPSSAVDGAYIAQRLVLPPDSYLECLCFELPPLGTGHCGGIYVPVRIL